jgi:hypothetical protein
MAGLSDRFAPDAAFEIYWRTGKARLDAELARWIPEFFRDLSPAQIDTIHTILADGKRIRGGLVCVVNDTLAGRIEDAIPRAVAIECIQAASLVHDDYVDGDTRRRDRAATWTLEGARKAVLLGDVIFAVAIGKMMELSREDGLAVVQAIATMARGAYQEIMNPVEATGTRAGGPLRPGLYERIIHLKTGALFGAGAKLGALAAAAPPAITTLAFEWGARLGEAYQIADDLEEVQLLDAHPAALPAALPRLAPLFLRFSAETNFEAALLSAGRETDCREWFRNARPALETKMREQIAARLDLAEKSVANFPETFDTRRLRAAPSAILRMDDAPARPDAPPISGQ